jgi:hypothetical protein
MSATQLPCRRHPTDSWHVHVHQDEIHVAVGDQRQRRLAAGRLGRQHEIRCHADRG